MTAVHSTGGDHALPHGALSDADLDAALRAADRELLRHIRARGHPGVALVAMMAASVPTCTIGTTATSDVSGLGPDARRAVAIIQLRSIIHNLCGNLIRARRRCEAITAAAGRVPQSAAPNEAAVGCTGSPPRPAGGLRQCLRPIALIIRIGQELGGFAGQLAGRPPDRRGGPAWAVAGAAMLLTVVATLGAGLDWLRLSWWNAFVARPAGPDLRAVFLIALSGAFAAKTGAVMTSAPLLSLALMVGLAGSLALAGAVTAYTGRSMPLPSRGGAGHVSHGVQHAVFQAASQPGYLGSASVAEDVLDRELRLIRAQTRELTVWAQHDSIPPSIASQIVAFVRTLNGLSAANGDEVHQAPAEPGNVRQAPSQPPVTGGDSACACLHLLSITSAVGTALARSPAMALARLDVNASGADLSGIAVAGLEMLAGVVWTMETNWPPELACDVRAASEEIGPGVYRVRSWHPSCPGPANADLTET